MGYHVNLWNALGHHRIARTEFLYQAVEALVSAMEIAVLTRVDAADAGLRSDALALRQDIIANDVRQADEWFSEMYSDSWNVEDGLGNTWVITRESGW